MCALEHDGVEYGLEDSQCMKWRPSASQHAEEKYLKYLLSQLSYVSNLSDASNVSDVFNLSDVFNMSDVSSMSDASNMYDVFNMSKY